MDCIAETLKISDRSTMIIIIYMIQLPERAKCAKDSELIVRTEDQLMDLGRVIALDKQCWLKNYKPL